MEMIWGMVGVGWGGGRISFFWIDRWVFDGDWWRNRGATATFCLFVCLFVLFVFLTFLTFFLLFDL